MMRWNVYPGPKRLRQRLTNSCCTCHRSWRIGLAYNIFQGNEMLIPAFATLSTFYNNYNKSKKPLLTTMQHINTKTPHRNIQKPRQHSLSNCQSNDEESPFQNKNSPAKYIFKAHTNTLQTRGASKKEDPRKIKSSINFSKTDRNIFENLNLLTELIICY